MFNKGFVWGAAAASYQIEGATNEDGRGLSVWDTFCTYPGRIRNGDNGNISCDHYHHYKEDIALMKQIGIKAYRLSISWSRMFPEGTIDKPNLKGIEFYDNLINELIANNIEPYITLFHWDYPQALFERGGWLCAESVKWFVDYASFVTDRYSDRVKNFITFNEPQCFVYDGHHNTAQAPGLIYAIGDVYKIVRNIQLSHGMAVIKMREIAKQKLNITISLVGNIKIPNDPNSKEDLIASRKAMMSTKMHGGSDAMWSELIYKGKLPNDIMTTNPGFAAIISEDDLKVINQPLDYYGVNMYTGERIRAKGDSFEVVPRKSGTARNALNWPNLPEVLYYGPKHLFETYGLPVVVTENGFNVSDEVFLDGKVHDTYRINFINKYLLQLERAIDEGVKVNGYFYWSIMDNFEWSHGYDERFGLIYIDYQTDSRTRLLKDSAYWYSEVISTNGAKLHEFDIVK